MGLIDSLSRFCIMKKVRDRANDSEEKNDESKDQAQFVSHLGYIDSRLKLVQLSRNRIKQTVLIVPAKHQKPDGNEIHVQNL